MSDKEGGKKMEKLFNIESVALTHPGMLRQDNQDNCFADAIGEDGQVLAVVADGVGGYAGGEEAARLAVTLLPQNLLQQGLDDAQSFRHAVISTHNAIYRHRFTNPALTRMSCVWTALLLDPAAGSMHFSHLGDTRLYAFNFNGSRLLKLSHDHSYIGQLEEQGVLTETQAMTHPRRNVIDRMAADFPLDDRSQYYQMATLPMAADITYLLCSDGLTDMITSAEIIDILSSPATLQEKAQSLIDAANRAGGRDNVTVVLVAVNTIPDMSDQLPSSATDVMNRYAHYIRESP